MKKVFKRAALITMSALMLGTSVASLASCGGDNDNTISVFIFAATQDQETNSDLVNNWAEEYSAKLVASGEKPEGFQIQTKINFQTDVTKYFSTLNSQLAAGTAPDVFYVSPKYVKAYSKVGYILDLTEYIDFESKENNYDINNVFGAALGFYAYDGKNVGEIVKYDSTKKKFVNESGNEAPIYGLPKDYSSFGLAYNANYFTEDLKKTYKTTLADANDKTADGKSIIQNAVTGEPANIINVGVPTTYFPYNFYKFKSYSDAVKAGDPVALGAQAVGGYTVTMPGFPGDTYKRANPDTSKPYDDSIGYVTLTYSEFGAMTWALTYYWTHLVGTNVLGQKENVYGNDQHEMQTYYLLGWLDANDCDYINARDGKSAKGEDKLAYQSCEAGTYINREGLEIQYGYDSERFIETYAAFVAYGSDWNGNSYYCGDGNNAGGYDKFKEGNSLFYGKGTWDTAGFNECDPKVLRVAQMTNVVSEDYALVSKIKDAEYKTAYYVNDGKEDTDCLTNEPTYKSALKVYTQDEINANQELRQDQWSSRMDSVGYGINSNLKKQPEWKAVACANLVAKLTIDRTAQVELTMAGAQLPNYADQCVDYLNRTGDFANMVTPDDANYQEYFECAKALVANIDRKTTVETFMKQNYPNLKYNEAYKDWSCKKVSGFTRAYQLLNVVTFDKNSRNIAIRMVAGTNAATDSCMYTFRSEWMTGLATYREACLIAYAKNGSAGSLKSYSDIKNSWTNDSTLCTPAAYCKHYVIEAQQNLNLSIQDEKNILDAAG